MRHRVHGTNLLQNPDLVLSPPSLHDLDVGVEIGNLHAPHLDFLPRRGNAVERAALRTGDRVGKCDVIFVSHHVLHLDLEIGECGVELRKPLHESLRSRPLIVGRVMVLDVRRKHLGQPVELVAVYDVAHLLLRRNIRFFAHGNLLGHKMQALGIPPVQGSSWHT